MAARQFHALLFHKCLEQLVQMRHQRVGGVQFVRAVLFDGADAMFLYVAGDDAGEGAAQVGGQLMNRLIRVQIQRGHGLVGGQEWVLEGQWHVEPPVEIERIVVIPAEQGQPVDAMAHGQGHGFRIINNDLVALCRFFTKRVANERIHLTEVVGAAGRAGEHHGQGNVRVVRVQQNAQ